MFWKRRKPATLTASPNATPGRSATAPPSRARPAAPPPRCPPRSRNGRTAKRRRRFDTAARRVIIGDGAEWISNLAAEPFPGTIEIVDISPAPSKSSTSTTPRRICAMSPRPSTVPARTRPTGGARPVARSVPEAPTSVPPRNLRLEPDGGDLVATWDKAGRHRGAFRHRLYTPPPRDPLERQVAGVPGPSGDAPTASRASYGLARAGTYRVRSVPSTLAARGAGRPRLKPPSPNSPCRGCHLGSPPMRPSSCVSTGRPAVGSTAFARALAASLGRRFVRVSLAGVHDAQAIRTPRACSANSDPRRVIKWRPNCLFQGRPVDAKHCHDSRIRGPRDRPWRGPVSRASSRRLPAHRGRSPSRTGRQRGG